MEVWSLKINILGTDYEIIRDSSGTNPKLRNANGYCETYSKKLVVEDKLEGEQILENIEVFKDKVLRHEIVHAFLYESGLCTNSDWADNEEIVDWIAIQIPKLVKAMHEARVI
jgi:hypothetical protein